MQFDWSKRSKSISSGRMGVLRPYLFPPCNIYFPGSLISPLVPCTVHVGLVLAFVSKFAIASEDRGANCQGSIGAGKALSGIRGLPRRTYCTACVSVDGVKSAKHRVGWSFLSNTISRVGRRSACGHHAFPRGRLELHIGLIYSAISEGIMRKRRGEILQKTTLSASVKEWH